MDLNNILKLIDAVSESSLSSFSLDDGNIKLNFETDKKLDMTSNPELIKSLENNLYNYNNANYDNNKHNMSNGRIADSDMSSNDDNSEQTKQKETEIISGKEITSPLVGTFYTSGSPEDEPMVKVGDTVKKGQVIGIIEAMKLMNEIESEYDGVVKQILVNNEDMVEYGQPLFIIG